MVKAVKLAFCEITQLFIRNTHAKFGSLNLCQSSEFRQNLDQDIFNL